MLEEMPYLAVQKVHVIFKTHLDIGFTDLSSTVLQKYVDIYIPRAIDLAERMNRDGSKQFIWTVGSFLVDYYLRHAGSAECERMEWAIQKGYISWHGLAATFHTELMDRRLLDFSLDISHDLDRRFGKKTIGAKMTDVPGHTIAIVPSLAAHGIRYLHIGVNAGSPMPHVPELFVWKNGDADVIVHYSDDYGKPLVIDGFDEAIEYAYTGDNTGPQSEDKIRAIMDGIRKKYPNAEVFASTISAYAQSVSRIQPSLPVITEEIGDTWIHGCGTDPYKVGCYNDLLQCKEQWIADGRLREGTEEYHDFMMPLMLIAEHTWSSDFKKYVFDFTNWQKSDFQEARRRDSTSFDLVPPGYKSLEAIIRLETALFRNGATTGSYSLYEKAQAEQTAYLTEALAALPPDLREEGKAVLRQRKPVKSEPCGERIWPGQFFSIGKYRAKIGAAGALEHLQVKERVVVENGGCAELSYEIFDAVTVKSSHYRYNVRLKNNLDWTEADFAKPGLETVPELSHKLYNFAATDIRRRDNRVVVFLAGDEEAAQVYGCPRCAELIYDFGDTLTITVNWFKKDASRIPEAIWLGFRFCVENPYMWQMKKIDTLISPCHVVSGGNRKRHCSRELLYQGADGGITVNSRHVSLVSVGARNLYSVDDRMDSLENGFYYNLFNNRWGTNYKTWCEDDISAVFEITFS